MSRGVESKESSSSMSSEEDEGEDESLGVRGREGAGTLRSVRPQSGGRRGQKGRWSRPWGTDS